MNTPEHIHDWDAALGWGVILGVSRCKICGEVATAGDFRVLSEERRLALVQDDY